MTNPLPIDWVRILEDIAWQLGDSEFAFSQVRVPAGSRVVATALGVNRSTLLRWQDGAEPRHHDGELILLHWSKLTGKAQAFAPRAKRCLSAADMA